MVEGKQASGLVKEAQCIKFKPALPLAEYHPMTYWRLLLCEAMRCQGLGNAVRNACVDPADL